MKPIFIVGVHRSGTTWVANALCNHSSIFGIQSSKYFGITESWFFSHLDGRYGDLKLPNNFSKFLETYIRTAYFQASEVSTEQLASIKPSTYANFFDRFMQLASELRSPGTLIPYWLEKTPVHTLYIEKIIHCYPAVKLVAVERNVTDVTRSTFALKSNPVNAKPIPFRQILKIVYHWHKYQSYIDHLTSIYTSQFIRLQYEDLCENPGFYFKECLDFLNLDWEDAVLEERYPPNTSARNKPDPLNTIDYKNIDTMSRLAETIPYSMHRLHECLRKPRNRKPIPFLIN
jgi:hypothetical protein